MVALQVLYQRDSKNSKTLIVGVTPSGNYPGHPGEIVTLDGGTIPNPDGKTVTGPHYETLTPTLPPKIGAQALGGYTAQLLPTAKIGQFNLSFWNATAELAAGAYPAAIANGTLTLELEFDIQG